MLCSNLESSPKSGTITKIGHAFEQHATTCFLDVTPKVCNLRNVAEENSTIDYSLSAIASKVVVVLWDLGRDDLTPD